MVRFEFSKVHGNNFFEQYTLLTLMEEQPFRWVSTQDVEKKHSKGLRCYLMKMVNHYQFTD